MNQSLTLVLLLCLRWAVAAPTWPSSVDELEDIMMLNTGYRARGFANAVTPCSAGAGPGRVTAAEFIRTAFHDMATANVYLGTGGLDASIVFELNNGGGDNIGQAFPTSLAYFAPFFSRRSSMADIIAMSMYTAVRACGGPAIPVKTGRVDATEAGPPGVPLPQNSLFTFQNQFARMGFNPTQMIQVVACGHTLGGVHASNFPQIVPVSSAPNDVKQFDDTAKFDSKIASDYVSGRSTDPLVVGPSQAARRASDLLVFNSDGNATITTMADLTYYTNTCRTLLQKMIDVVPAGVSLTDPIAPYDIKPVALQLTLQNGGSEIQFAGEIRVRTTSRPASQISSVQIVYKDRTEGGSNKISATQKGTAAGFDDNFTFYAFSAPISSQSSISSFNVLVTLASGATESYDNNGSGYSMQDTVMFQAPQSCVTDSNGQKLLSVTAAVRLPATSAELLLTLKVPRDVITPELQTQTVAMTQKTIVGPYNIVTGTYLLEASQAQNTEFDIAAGQAKDMFKSIAGLGTTCVPLSATGSSSSSSSSSSSFSSSSSSSSILSSRTLTGSTLSTFRSSTSSTSSTTSQQPNPPPSPSTTPSQPGYLYQGCYTDSTSARVLTGRSQSTSTNTYASCAAYCSGYTYFGVEYGSECYCGNQFTNPSAPAPKGDTECNRPCSGDATKLCGAGNRLTLFKNQASGPTSASNIPGWSYTGCYTDSTSARVIKDKYNYDNALSIERCAAACKGYKIFGTEYANQCYCGNSYANPTTKVVDGECGYACAGNGAQACGAGNRLSVYTAAAGA
ncbi:MAG: hypothetical protein L6R36_006665 [Xanthoria steineri]|nr:MAG: hypothetical protein L6R36_006665 [Xanthoria steineri]